MLIALTILKCNINVTLLRFAFEHNRYYKLLVILMIQFIRENLKAWKITLSL